MRGGARWSFHRLHKVVTYAYAGLGLLALALGADLPRAAAVAAGAAFAGSWFVEGPVLQSRTYERAWNAAIVGVFLLQVARAVLFGAPPLQMGIEYAAFLQISRLYHRRSAREYQQVAVLAFLHLVAATVLTTDLSYAFVFLGFVVVTPWMLALTHLRGALGEDGRPHAQPAREVAGARFLAGTAALAVPLFAVTAALFLLFPRVGMGYLSFRSEEGAPVAGFGRNVELGGFGVIRDDATVVLRVRVPERRSSPAPERLALRMRGTSFDHYDGRSWSRTPLRGEHVPRQFDQYALRRWPRPEDRELTIVLDPLAEPVVFLPEGAVAISIPPRVQGGRDRGRQLVRAPGLDVRYVDGDGLRLLYAAHVSTDARDLAEPLDDDARARYLQLPEGHERVRELALQVTAEATTDAERARRIERHLRDTGAYAYSLELPAVGDEPPLEAFLFEARHGHCEYFSTAMAVMLRAAGVPARNVTGFVGGTYNPFGDYYAVRQGDAHSWVEAYVGGRWVTFDPTPPARHAAAPASGWLDGARALVDAMRTRWSTHVVGYDMRDQLHAFRRLTRWWGQWRGDAGARAERDAATAPSPSVPAGVPTLVAVAALLLFFGLSLAWVRRRRSQRHTDPDPALALYRELDRALGKVGRARSPDVTPHQHAERLAREGFPAAPAVREVTDAYLESRFAGGALSPAQRSHLRRRVRDVART
jgi:protein-glutamine gamma-glutamyltransferase